MNTGGQAPRDPFAFATVAPMTVAGRVKFISAVRTSGRTLRVIDHRFGARSFCYLLAWQAPRWPLWILRCYAHLCSPFRLIDRANIAKATSDRGPSRFRLRSIDAIMNVLCFAGEGKLVPRDEREDLFV